MPIQILFDITSAYCAKLYAQTRAVFGFHLRYTRVLGRAPAEADLQRHFGITPPSVHQKVLTSNKLG